MRSTNDRGSFIKFILNHPGNTKITELYPALFCDEHIGTFDISVYNACLVNPSKSLSYLSENWNDPFLGYPVWCRRFHQGCNTSTSTIFSHHPHSWTNRKCFNDVIDITGLLFTQNLQGSDLFEELAVGISKTRIQRITFINVNDLHGHNSCGGHVFALVDSAKATFTDQLSQDVLGRILSDLLLISMTAACI